MKASLLITYYCQTISIQLPSCAFVEKKQKQKQSPQPWKTIKCWQEGVCKSVALPRDSYPIPPLSYVSAAETLAWSFIRVDCLQAARARQHGHNKTLVLADTRASNITFLCLICLSNMLAKSLIKKMKGRNNRSPFYFSIVFCNFLSSMME